MTTQSRPGQAISLRDLEIGVINSLRAHVAQRRSSESAKPSLEQVKAVCSDICSRVPLVETSKKMALPSGVDAEKFVLDVVATFGTWIAHSVGSPGLDVEYEAHKEQLELLSPTEAGGSAVLAPLGYEPSASHRRDVGKALAAVVSLGNDQDVIARFVSRTYAQRPAQISYPLVSGVWGFASRGRLHELVFVSDDLTFQALAVEAFDLLDVARADAARAVEALASGSLEGADALALVDAAYWVDEPRMRSIRRAAELASSSDLAKARLARELGSLRIASQGSGLVPDSVGALTLGQVQRICSLSGIKVRSENRLEETEIRATLKELGLTIDADRLVPVALRCADSGDLDAFWDVMQARVDGAPNWSELLEELTQ